MWGIWVRFSQEINYYSAKCGRTMKFSQIGSKLMILSSNGNVNDLKKQGIIIEFSGFFSTFA